MTDKIQPKPKIYKFGAYFVLGLVLLTIYQNCSKAFVSQSTNFSSLSAAHRAVINQTFTGAMAAQSADAHAVFQRKGFFSPDVYLSPIQITADSFGSMLYQLDKAQTEAGSNYPDPNKLNYINMGMGSTPAGIKAVQDAQYQPCDGCAGGGE
jgi:streptogramin lyase